jgi:hypothetical protein
MSYLYLFIININMCYMNVVEGLITMCNRNLFPTTIACRLPSPSTSWGGGYDLYIIQILMMPIGVAWVGILEATSKAQEN